MSDFDDLLASEQFAVNARKPKPQHPKGWEPHVEERGDTASIVTTPIPADVNADERMLLELMGFDADEWEICSEIVNCRTWQGVVKDNDGEIQQPWNRYYKFDARRRVAGARADLDALVRRVLKRKPRKPSESEGEHALVVCFADWQVGKGRQGATDVESITETRERLSSMIGAVEDRWKALKRAGVNLGGMYMLGLGDLGESCSGHYPQQGFTTVLNMRDQNKLIRWGIDSALEAWSAFAPKIAVKAVGGNHGEERQNGKSYTDFADNRDVSVFEDVAYGFAKNPDRYGHISFSVPNHDLTLTFEHEGTIIGMAHGHQAGFGTGDPRTKLHNWWRGQMDGKQPIGDADVLLTAHFHHPWMIRRGARTHLGCPALDAGSAWFTNTSGQECPPGTLTFVLGPEGWSGLEIV